ncbi:hypothetical protein JTB14_037373 [Gonioctena quinquepunctata]|nr:hypothetical protein JTB14_037373 [Gonioctena quinquepunctata]
MVFAYYKLTVETQVSSKGWTFKRKMDPRMGENNRERTRRPTRNKRYSRRIYGEDRRPPKRLFTPEIKRFLKDWLVRRRENPYPNRDEKKMLAIQTGLTYIQVCNWFANWRRKLKNAGKEPHQKTWGNLIKTYNNQVQGNVEHFSICSDDSIWEESEPNSNYGEVFYQNVNLSQFTESQLEQNYLNKNKLYYNNNSKEVQNQCYFVSSTTENDPVPNPFSQSSSKYKNHIMEKYLRDCQQPETIMKNIEENKPSMISKWLESAAKFKPSEHSYLDWTLAKSTKRRIKKNTDVTHNFLVHGREEIDAAEALTTLANARYNKL